MRDRCRIGKGVKPIFFCAIVSALILSNLNAQDIFNTKQAVPSNPGSPLISETNVPSGLSGQPLKLEEAIERALYYNPATRQQWANIKVRAAGVGLGYSAYLPTLNGQLQGTRQISATDVHGFPQLNSNSSAYTNMESVSLSWVLYDFGGRAGGLKNAKELLLAAQANHEAALRDVFAAVTKDYYAAQAAQGTVVTTAENENIAEQSYKVAVQRVDKGVSPISDELQANTAYIQAKIDRTKAEGDARIAIGTLASDMGFRPDMPILLPKVDDVVQPDKAFQSSIAELMEDAIMHYPSVRAAEAEYLAAEAKVRQVRGQGLPSVSLIAKSQRSDQPLNAEVGVSSFDATETQSYVGAQVSVPLFDGFSTDYQIRQAQAQVEVQRYALDRAKQRVGLDVWSSYQLLQEAAKNLINNAKLLDIAQQSFAAAQSRYESGVGTMTERLNAQTALASARLQWIRTLTDWRTSRLQLAAKLGTMGAWWIGQ